MAEGQEPQKKMSRTQKKNRAKQAKKERERLEEANQIVDAAQVAEEAGTAPIAQLRNKVMGALDLGLRNEGLPQDMWDRLLGTVEEVMDSEIEVVAGQDRRRQDFEFAAAVKTIEDYASHIHSIAATMQGTLVPVQRQRAWSQLRQKLDEDE